MDYSKGTDNYIIGKLDLKVVGVLHTSHFLEENEDFLKKEINSPKYVFFETGLKKNKFYQGLAKLLDEKNKSIYVPDALEKEYGFRDIILGIIGIDIFENSLLKEPISRRNFLKKSGIALGGLYLATSTMGIREDFLNKIVGKDGTFDNKIGYDAVQDFRNIVSVDNITRAVNELGFEGSATYFIGYHHLNGLRAYFNNPEMRKKRRLYFLQESSSTKKIKEYKNIEGSWKIIDEI